MTDASAQELKQSIDELTAYRDRLKQDVIGMGQKLKLPQKKIDATLADHPELQRIEGILQQLQDQIAQQGS